MIEDIQKLRSTSYKAKADLEEKNQEHLIEVRQLTDHYIQEIESSLI